MTMIVDNQLKSLGPHQDELDAATILHLFRGFAEVPDNPERNSRINRHQRETLQKIWQEPRMDDPKLSHNKPHAYPWSPSAREVYFDEKPTTNRLHLEHVIPLDELSKEVLTHVQDPESDAATLQHFLETRHLGLRFAILTASEHRRMPKVRGDLQNPWTRYQISLGLEEKDFLALHDDPRY